MTNPNPDQSGLTQNVNKRRQDAANERKAKAKRAHAVRSENAKIFSEDLDIQLEIMAYELHLYPHDKDAARNLGIFMRYKMLKDKASSGDFMDMEY